ncbi:thioredoxin family protein [Desulfobulbus elongatus]|uniref:thioredoxin family protein n=1 Tax=Desulfobulbus elongatus TaxID=53332 RepID=UPI00048A0F77|nr:thioredoxin family protein [Desulfobulbus elongatus]
MIVRHPAHVLFPLMLLLLCGCSEPPRFAKPGDRVEADYTCRLADGGLVETTLAHVAGNDTLARSPIFSLRDSYRPFSFQVSEQSAGPQSKPFDPLEQKIGAAIANRITELPLDRTTPLHLQSAQIENFPPRDRYLRMATNFTLPRMREMPVQEFEARYGQTPQTPGTKVGEDSDYPGVVRGVNNEFVIIYYSVRAEAHMPLAWGTGVAKEKDADTFEVTVDVRPDQLVPRIGGLPGRVSSVEKDQFVIDFAQSFAGETLFCEVTPRSYVPDRQAKQSPVNWVDDFDRGLEQARQQGKPAVLFLYADECPTCEQMLNRTFPDPALDRWREQFIWIKASGTQHPEYADRFKQREYPLIVVLNGMGGELDLLPGLHDLPTLAYRLDQVLAKRTKG